MEGRLTGFGELQLIEEGFHVSLVMLIKTQRLDIKQKRLCNQFTNMLFFGVGFGKKSVRDWWHGLQKTRDGPFF